MITVLTFGALLLDLEYCWKYWYWLLQYFLPVLLTTLPTVRADMLKLLCEWTATRPKCTATLTSSSRFISSAATSSTWWISSCRASCSPCSSWSASVCRLMPERRSRSVSPSSWRSPSSCWWLPTPSREHRSPFRSSVRTGLTQYVINKVLPESHGPYSGADLHILSRHPEFQTLFTISLNRLKLRSHCTR